MKRIVAIMGNGKIFICAEEDLEVLFIADGEYVEVVPKSPDCVSSRFAEHEAEFPT